jgi:hypothetical protein
MDVITTADVNAYIGAARSRYKLKSLQNQITLLNTIFEDAASQGHCTSSRRSRAGPPPRWRSSWASPGVTPR